MKYLIKNKYWDIVEGYNLDKLLYLLVDRYDYVNRWNELFWQNKNKLVHRNYDLPSFIGYANDLSWAKDGKTNRKENKPAILFYNGQKVYSNNIKN